MRLVHSNFLCVLLVMVMAMAMASRLPSASAFCRVGMARWQSSGANVVRCRDSLASRARDYLPFSGNVPSHVVASYGRIKASSMKVHLTSTTSSIAKSDDDVRHASTNMEMIVLWRGESTAGYSLQLRHLELSNSIAADFQLDSAPELKFDGMLEYNGDRQLSSRELDLFKGAIQFVSHSNGSPIPSDWMIGATMRCSLIRESYEVIAKADTYEELARRALESAALNDVLRGGDNETATWRVRLRQYGSTSTNAKGSRYGKNVRSPITAEKRAIQSMAELFVQFAGKVHLEDPDCSLYLFEGTKNGQIILARVLAKGPKISSIAPKTRICITNTPLEAVAAYNLCNFARVRERQNVLDPYAGSCATLLAAASLASTCKTVGIEIALKKFVKKEDILEDFSSRGLQLPANIFRGDSMIKAIRDKARQAIGGKPFDAIVTDPPYGIREKAGDVTEPPLVQLFSAIAEDRDAGTPLLKVGGRLTAFVPISPGQDLSGSLPNDELLKRAGMELTEKREQPLNEQLARWLVAYTCIR